jgi:carboxyl-terminal processing protease
MKKLLLHSLLLLLFISPVKAQTVLMPEQGVVASVESKRLQTFDRVWNTINERHFDPTFGGVDWNKMKGIYQPKALSAATDDEFYKILQEMLGELNQSHFSIIPPGAEMTPTIFGEGEIGVDVQLIGKDAVITKVKTDSSAAKNNLKTGFIIRRVDGKTVAELLAPVEERLLKRKYPAGSKMVYRKRALLSALSGKVGSVVNVETLNAQNRLQIFKVERMAFTGEMSKPMGNFPAQRLDFESKRLAGNIGYIRFNIWVMQHLPKIRDAILEMSDASGIIFDLRGNPGGLGAMTTALAGSFVKEQTSLGTSRTRNALRQLTVYPQEYVFEGKIVILTDSATGSASELFAAGMQGIKRAKIVGETTAGAVLPSLIEKLPDGSTLLYAISDYKSPDDILIEGRGVTPDIEIKLTRQSLLRGLDLQLETAIKEIQKG